MGAGGECGVAKRLDEIFAAQVARAPVAALGPAVAARRAGLLSAQLLGLALTRYLLRLPAVTVLTTDEIAETLTPAVRSGSTAERRVDQVGGSPQRTRRQLAS